VIFKVTIHPAKRFSAKWQSHMRLDRSPSNKCAATLLANDVTLHAKLVKSLSHRQAADFKRGPELRLRRDQIAGGKVTVFNAIQHKILDLPIQGNEAVAIEPAVRNR
jgi:hypothetical protein